MPGLYLPGSKPFGYGAKAAPAPVPAGHPGQAATPSYAPSWKAPTGLPSGVYNPPPVSPIAAGDQPPSYLYPHESVSPATQLARVVPALNEPAPCPVETCQNHTGPMQAIHSIIVELNDRHGWTRERIADWLDSLPYDLTIQPASEGD